MSSTKKGATSATGGAGQGADDTGGTQGLQPDEGGTEAGKSPFVSFTAIMNDENGLPVVKEFTTLADLYDFAVHTSPAELLQVEVMDDGHDAELLAFADDVFTTAAVGILHTGEDQRPTAVKYPTLSDAFAALMPPPGLPDLAPGEFLVHYRGDEGRVDATHFATIDDVIASLKETRARWANPESYAKADEIAARKAAERGE